MDSIYEAQALRDRVTDLGYRDTLQVRLDAILSILKNRVTGQAGFAIHGSVKDDALTTNNITYWIDGAPYILALDTQVTSPAAAQQADSTECFYLLSVNAAGTVAWTKGTEAASGAVLPATPAASAAYAAVKVVLDGTAFTLGTTAFDASNVVSTFYDLGYGVEVNLTAIGQLATPAS